MMGEILEFKPKKSPEQIEKWGEQLKQEWVEFVPESVLDFEQPLSADPISCERLNDDRLFFDLSDAEKKKIIEIFEQEFGIDFSQKPIKEYYFQ